jgi:hypothetical protein
VIVADLDDIFSDPDDDQLAYSFEISPRNAGLIITIEAVSNIVTLQPEQDYNGEAFVTITADDRHGSVEDVDFSVTINSMPDDPKPIRQLALNIQLQEDFGRYIIADLDTVFVDPDGDELWFRTVDGEHLGLDITENNVLSLTPDKDWDVDESFRLIISDEEPVLGGPVRDLRSRGSANYSNYASVSFNSSNPRRDAPIELVFNVEITPENDAPKIINPIPDQQFDEDDYPWEVANLYNVFEEVDGENLSFDYSNVPEPLIASVTNEGVLQLIAPENFNGNQIEIVVTAGDGTGLTTSDMFYVDILSINDPPSVIGAIGDIEVKEDSQRPWFIADLDDVFEDVDGDQLSYDVEIGIVPQPDDYGIEWDIDDGNVLTFSVVDNFNIDVIITVIADDGHNQLVSASFGHTRELRSIGKDTGPVRSLRSTNAIGNESNNFAFFQANTTKSNTRRDDDISDTFTFTITPENDSPHWIEDDFTVAYTEGDSISLRLFAEDADLIFGGEHLTLDIMNDGGVFNRGAVFVDNGDGSGDFIWIPGTDDAGGYTVDFSVTDQSGASDQLAVLFRIIDLNRPLINDLHIGDEVFTEDDPERFVGNMSDYFIDPDGDPISYNIQTPVGIKARLVSNELLYVRPEPNWNGNADVILVASDGLSLIADTLNVSVTAVNDPPTAFDLLSPVDSFFVHSYPMVEFNWEESIDIVEDSTVVYDLSISFNDSVYNWSGLDIEFKVLPRTFFVIDPDLPTEVMWWVFATDGEDTIYSADTASVVIAPIRTQITKVPIIPDEYALGRPYPNPFNNIVSVIVDLPDPSWVKLEVYDLSGGLVASLINEDLNAGRHLAYWDGYTHTGKRSSSGSYIVRLRSSMGTKTQRVLLMR